MIKKNLVNKQLSIPFDFCTRSYLKKDKDISTLHILLFIILVLIVSVVVNDFSSPVFSPVMTQAQASGLGGDK